MQSAMAALHFVVPWLQTPEMRRATLQVQVRFSRTCRAGAAQFDPADIGFEQALIEAEEDEVRQALDHERERLEEMYEIGVAMWRELVDDSD